MPILPPNKWTQIPQMCSYMTHLQAKLTVSFENIDQSYKSSAINDNGSQTLECSIYEEEGSVWFVGHFSHLYADMM